jgi:predicted lactoylglutathione lyase
MKKNWAGFTLIILILTQLPSFTAVRSRLNIDHNNSKKQNSKKHIALLAKNCRLVKGDANFVVCVGGELKKDQVFGREKTHLLKERSRKLIQKFKNSNRRFIKPEIEKKTPDNKGLRKISLEMEFCEVIPGKPVTFICAVGSSQQTKISKEVLSQVKQTAKTLHKNYKPKKPRSSNNSKRLFSYNSVQDTYNNSCYTNFGMSCNDCYSYYGMSCEDYDNMMNNPCYMNPHSPECTGESSNPDDECYSMYGMSCEDYDNMMNNPCYMNPHSPECTGESSNPDDECYSMYGMSCEDYDNMMNNPCYMNPHSPECTGESSNPDDECYSMYGMSCEDYDNMMNSYY